ncbi:MAG: 50S ribosomal protein L9 [Bacteroidales bacterium]|nr:50S ribosomal protein L9 [Bacteroidales bacterium]
MEVILTQDVAKLGYKDDIVNVKNGYANNYLFPQGMAIMATATNKKILAENIRQRAFKEERIRKEAETLKEALEGKTIRVAAKASANGQIFGSVNNIQVAEALKEQYSYDIDRKKIVVDGNRVKEVGSYPITINIHKDIKAEITLEVYAE